MNSLKYTLVCFFILQPACFAGVKYEVLGTVMRMDCGDVSKTEILAPPEAARKLRDDKNFMNLIKIGGLDGTDERKTISAMLSEKSMKKYLVEKGLKRENNDLLRGQVQVSRIVELIEQLKIPSLKFNPERSECD